MESVRVLLVAQFPSRPDLRGQFLRSRYSVGGQTRVLAVELHACTGRSVQAGRLLDIGVAPADGNHLFTISYIVNGRTNEGDSLVRQVV